MSQSSVQCSNLPCSTNTASAIKDGMDLHDTIRSSSFQLSSDYEEEASHPCQHLRHLRLSYAGEIKSY